MRKTLLFLLLFAPAALRAQVAVAPLTLPRAQFLSSTGLPMAGGCVNFFATGTSTPQAIYADSTGTSQLANPLTLDAAGEASVWMSNTGYDIVANTGVPNTACSVSVGTQLWRENNKNPFSIINGGSNYIVASGTVDPSGVPGELAYRSDIPCFRGFTAIWDCFATLTGVQTFTNKTFTSPAINTPIVTGGTFTTPTIGGILNQNGPATYLSLTNNNATGTTLNNLVKLDGSGNAVSAIGTDTGGIIGICVAGCGTSGSATIQTSGSVKCTFDFVNAIAGHYVQNSSNTSGDCLDAGASYPIGTTFTNQIIGRALATGSGAVLIDLFSAEIQSVQNFVKVPVKIDSTASANITSTPLLTPAGNGFYRVSCYIVLTQAATTSSSLPNCNITWTDADTGVAESVTTTSQYSGNVVGGLNPDSTGAQPSKFYAKSGVAISYSTSGYASSGATSMQYAIHIRLEGPF